MSGGYFNYKQYELELISDCIESYLEHNKDDLKDETLERFREAVKILKIASIYVRCIDWLLSGDDSEESFHKHLKDEAEKLYNGNFS